MGQLYKRANNDKLEGDDWRICGGAIEVIQKQDEEILQWREMGRRFVNKVDNGLAKSTETYNEIKGLLK